MRRFTISLVGDLQITQNDTHLFIIGTHNQSEAQYLKTPSSPYQLTLTALQPVMDSLRAPNPQEFHFDTPMVRYAWVPGGATLQITGDYQGKPAQLLLENHQATVTQGQQRLAVLHYTSDITLDPDLRLQRVITAPQGYRLQFQSPTGEIQFHQLANDTFSSQGINYQIRHQRLIAIGGDNHLIDGRSLMRYQPTRGVDIYLNHAFNPDELSREPQRLRINPLTLQQLPQQTRIYFEQQAFSWQALQETTHRHRHHHRIRRQLPAISSTASRPTPWITQLWQGLLGVLADTHPRLPQAPLSPTTPEYTSGHLQGGLQLLDLIIRKWSGKKYSPHRVIPSDADDKRRTTASQLAYAAQGPSLAQLQQSLAAITHEPQTTSSQEPWLAYPRPTTDTHPLTPPLT